MTGFIRCHPVSFGAVGPSDVLGVDGGDGCLPSWFSACRRTGKENGRKTPEEIGRAILTDPDPVLV